MTTWLIVGLAYTDTSRDVEAIYREMRKLGVTSGTTTEFTLHDSSGADGTRSRQGSVTDQPKTSTNDGSDAALNRVVLPPGNLGIYVFVYLICSESQILLPKEI